jgi:hypothetical protein
MIAAPNPTANREAIIVEKFRDIPVVKLPIIMKIVPEA